MTGNEADNIGNEEAQGDISVPKSAESTSGDSALGDGALSAKSPMAGGRAEVTDAPRVGALEVVVDHSIDKAMKILKRKLIKEGLFKELKMRRYFEKPSERKKRKLKESLKKLRKEESRLKKNTLL